MIPRKSTSRRVRSSAQAVCQPLERRMLLSLSPAGPEFHVNTFTSGPQRNPAIAADGDGDFVVVWQDDFQEGPGGSGIFARRFDAAGNPLGGEIHVNTFTPSTQANPAVAMDADGDFVIAWSSTDAVNGGIRAQRYNAAGVPQGTEFSVSSTGGLPAVAMDVAGNFVVAFAALLAGGSNVDIYVRRYDFLGAPQSGAVRANSHLTSVQLAPSVAMDADGDFVVAWESYLQDGSDYGVYAQHFSAAGVPQGAEFRVNSFTTSTQRSPAVAMDLSGDFLIAWNSYGQDGSGDSVFAQRYNGSGVAQGGEFQVNTTTTNSQFSPAVAMDVDGDFLISWTSNLQDGSSYGVYAQQFSAAGATIGSEFRVNTFTTNSQSNAAVAADHKGDYIVSWVSNTQEGVGGSYGIYAQRYAESTDTAGPIVADVLLHGKRVLPYSTHAPALQQILLTFSENMDVTGGSTGANSVTNPANWLLTRNGLDITSDISSITFGFNATTNRYEAELNLSTSHTSGNFLVQARDTLRDVAGNALDGNFDGAPGGSFPMPFSLATSAPIGNELQVNVYTTGSQHAPQVASDDAGNFVVAWQSFAQDGSGYGIYARRYDASGVAQGGEFRVNTITTGDQISPAVAMDADGDFVVAWQNDAQTIQGIYAQRYNAAGVAQGSEFLVSSGIKASLRYPRVAMDADGDFVVAWTHYISFNASDAYARRYNAGGAAQGEAFLVNTFTTGGQVASGVAMHREGDFVVVWGSFEQDGSEWGAYAQRYNAAGIPQGGEFRVNTFTLGSQIPDAVAIDADGDFVITLSGRQGGSDIDVYARQYGFDGFPQGPEFRVNTFTTGDQIVSSVAMDQCGNFVVTWQSTNLTVSDDIYAQRYNSAGTPHGGEFRVNSSTPGEQRNPSIAMDADGDFVIVWVGPEIHAQRYTAQHTPTVGLMFDSPDPVAAGTTLSLATSNDHITDDGIITSVSFYRESNGVAGLQVGVEGDTLVGTDTTPTPGGAWSVAVSTTGLAPGTYTYWAQATDDANLIGTPASTTNQVQSSFPIILFPHRLLFAFNANVSASLGTEDIVLENLTTMQTIPSSDLSVSYDLQTDVATFTYNGPGALIAGVLPDGNYRATLLAAGITDPNGVPLPADIVFNFFFLNGDANHDGRVNLDDFNILAANFGQSPRDFTQGDFNYDMVVNLNDFNILASRFGQTLAPQAAPVMLTSVAFGQRPIEDDTDALDDLFESNV